MTPRRAPVDHAGSTAPAVGITARAVVVAYHGVPVVDGVDLDVPAGAWTALIGPNGAGKTSLLRALAGTVPAGGSIRVGDAEVAALDARSLARRMATVPQNPVVPGGMTVFDYALLGRTPYIGAFGVEGPRDVHVVAQVLERLDLESLSDRPLAELSGGELQRAVLARALAQDAPVLVLDEPTSALDLGHQLHVLELVDQLRRERGLTVLAAMHDLTLAGQFADELVLLSCGRRVASGPPVDVLRPSLLRRIYGADVTVLSHPDGGVVVVPSRAPSRISPSPSGGR